jgi:hypothetical protein
LAYLNGSQPFINFGSSDLVQQDLHVTYEQTINPNLNDSLIETKIKQLIKEDWDLLIESQKLRQEFDKIRQDNLKIATSIHDWKGKSIDEIIEQCKLRLQAI